MMKVGIFFGGRSREREISFAGGRTVYDNLDQSLFKPVPIFVDSLGNFIELEWSYIYKGSIRDFYPPVEDRPPSPHNFQIYIESIKDLTAQQQREMIERVGQPITPEQLAQKIDFAFLTLHGPYGEDGSIQGILEFYDIPYTGAGLFPSALGINKRLQKQLLEHTSFLLPGYTIIHRDNWVSGQLKKSKLENILQEIGQKIVVKPANLGSSLGVTLLQNPEWTAFKEALNRAFFMKEMKPSEWKQRTQSQKIQFIRDWVDIRVGNGMPVRVNEEQVIYHPEDFYEYLENYFSENDESLLIEALQGEQEVIIESMIEGKEFSCIVIQNEKGEPVALPPTEIVKGEDVNVFDYRSKYLAGQARKRTPIQLPDKQIQQICKECERLFQFFDMDVYARIDGFMTPQKKVYLNDPNTTSGMLPSSFFFHQAAEIGLNPSQFLTYIIRTSLNQRQKKRVRNFAISHQLSHLDSEIKSLRTQQEKKKTIGVLMGGYTAERHISVESGRNVYEKLSSSPQYHPIPIFVTGSPGEHQLYQIPINLLLKDNADDIRDKIESHQTVKAVENIKTKAQYITEQYSSPHLIHQPQQLTYQQLAQKVDGVFNTVHGRPGEDGTIQENLEEYQVPYNGSGIKTLEITIDKHKTNKFLASKGFPTLKQELISRQQWQNDSESYLQRIEEKFDYPVITKPVDEGCSAAVKKINNREQLQSYAAIAFREQDQVPEKERKKIQLLPNEEFPCLETFLVEELAHKQKADRLLEITGGLLTHHKENGKVEYEIFEPSETVASQEILSLEEKFLAGEGQNITPARFSDDPETNRLISEKVRKELLNICQALEIEGYARIDAFLRIYNNNEIELIVIEINALPGMTPATCIFHQAALNDYKPLDFISKILEYGFQKPSKKPQTA